MGRNSPKGRNAAGRNPSVVNRRAFLAAAAAGGLAGCFDRPGTPTATDAAPDDGYPPPRGDVPTERPVDTASYPTTTRDGVAVPLAPIEDAHYWFRRREARFADARGLRAYRAAHVLGAVSSPAGGPAGDREDPVLDWPTGDRVVCYCACPHHLSSIRAAALLRSGYEEVYVIDEGFGPWFERGYPVAGEEVAALPPAWTVRGRADPARAGATAWARHPPSGQREAAAIGDDGGFALRLRFYDVGPDSPVTVSTPDYSVTAPLGTLADGVVDRSGTVRR